MRHFLSFNQWNLRVFQRCHSLYHFTFNNRRLSSTVVRLFWCELQISRFFFRRYYKQFPITLLSCFKDPHVSLTSLERRSGYRAKIPAVQKLGTHPQPYMWTALARWLLFSRAATPPPSPWTPDAAATNFVDVYSATYTASSKHKMNVLLCVSFSTAVAVLKVCLSWRATSPVNLSQKKTTGMSHSVNDLFKVWLSLC